MRFLLFAGVPCLIQCTLASLVNVTIDDTFGDPQTGALVIYSPASAWENGTRACSTACVARPDPDKLYNGTWHETTTFIPDSGDSKADKHQMSSASVTFNGSAIYVYGVTSSSSKTSNMTFFIDNEVVGTFYLASVIGNESEYQYNVPLYVNHSIPAGVHNFTLQNGQKGGQKSLIMLDSIVYTLNNSTGTLLSTPSSTQSSAKPRSKVMLGSVLGTLLGLLFIVPGLYLCVRYHRRRQRLAPSQQYAASKAAGTLFEARRIPPPLKNIDLLPEMEEACAVPRRAYYPEALRAFITNSARSATRSEAASSASQSTRLSQREPPLRPGRTFRVMNR